jgi:flagellar basal-body rod modification protein FlgD
VPATELTAAPSLTSLYGANSSDAANLYAQGQTDLASEEVFLQLLMTQMKNQDPLDPMENQEFISQLAQLSTVEQLRTTNSNLEVLQLYQSSINNAQAVSLIGKEIRASGDAFHYDGQGAAEMDYNLAADAATVTVAIYDSTGAVVKTLELGAMSAGDQVAEWDGTNTDGSPLEAGDYTFKVTATASDGSAVTASTYITGVVDGVAFENGMPILKVGTHDVTMGEILEVQVAR